MDPTPGLLDAPSEGEMKIFKETKREKDGDTRKATIVNNSANERLCLSN